ncbi:MAG: putative peroxiredoxin [Crocinitomicaceae bacterium]|jgi:peroxiredoxin (alkyl hydroperoxide reductase subunit C)|nr:MAG: putative peroxiredoxin [Crocinitomicaceae bacterium]|tara:strand:- start:6850 stop:7491 length:642 start_codon:yes stop_codon:yes gene_type:complete
MSNFVGKKFPSIEVDAMNEMGDTFKVNVLEEAVKNKKKVVLFWYPKDFTYVCPTELHAFQEALPEFDKRNTILIGASCDTPEVHFAWLSTPKDNGGIEGVTYPILADANRNLANILKVLDTTNERYDEELDAVQTDGDSTPYRATFILDEDGMVFHQGMNFFPVGRNINEFLRLIDAYAHNQKFGEVCPANWEEGKDAMKENRDGVADYLAKH